MQFDEGQRPAKGRGKSVVEGLVARQYAGKDLDYCDRQPRKRLAGTENVQRAGSRGVRTRAGGRIADCRE